MVNMLSDSLRQRYASAAREAERSILRHPPRSMAETLQLLAKRAETAGEPDYYGSGALIEDFEARLASQFGKPAALFLPSGTLAQPLALRIHCDARSNAHVALHPTSHLVLHEEDGYQALWGLQGQLVGNTERPIEPEDLAGLSSLPGALLLELPMREIGGQLQAWSELEAMADWARSNDVALHMDGARLWQCAAAYHKDFADIAALSDSVYLSFYKDMGGIAGAVLLGETDFIAQARVWARRAGGNLFSLYPYLLAAEQGMEDNLSSMEPAVAYARELGLALAQLPGVRVNPDPPQVAMFHLHIDGPVEPLVERVCAHAEQTSTLALPLPRAEKEGVAVFEISVGRRTMQHSTDFWVEQLRACLDT
ncbi:threonine aldolase family protein [Aliidiomarina sp. Khilg15.8]